MHLALSGEQKPSNTSIFSVLRDASCSHGWLRLVVQCIFGTVTVISFILILLTALPWRFHRSESENYRCIVSNCRVLCKDAHMQDGYVNDIVISLASADELCDRIFFTLVKPQFEKYTLPPEWLSRVRSNVEELTIESGNLRNIAPQAFMTQFAANIKVLVLEKITITNWRSDTLVGLSNLKELCIKNSRVLVEANALQAVNNNLRILSITTSGNFDPASVTGSIPLRQLRTVVLSSNNFYGVLRNNSFTRLTSCRLLYLNSCNINSIEKGTFDYLVEIKFLYLNGNHLKTIPPGLFSLFKLNPNHPKVSLQDNHLYCDCADLHLRNLSSQQIFLVEPTCYYPNEHRGMPLIDFDNYCTNTSLIKHDYYDDSQFTDANDTFISVDNRITIYASSDGCSNNFDDNALKFIFPIESLKCTNDVVNSFFVLSRLAIGYETSAHNELMQPTFAIRLYNLSMIEIRISASKSFALIWFQSDCPNTIYCINTLPISYLRIFNIDLNSQFTFCPINLQSGNVVDEKCIQYGYENSILDIVSKVTAFRVLIYLLTSLICTIIGACCVYAIIRKFPTLLKGNNRILFVKHKNVDALVLPPKVSLRNTLSIGSTNSFTGNDIFVVPNRNWLDNNLIRSKSIRSHKSAAPSYISAVQPSHAQLAEWRLKHHFDNNLTVTSLDTLASYACVEENSTPPYFSLCDCTEEHPVKS